MINIYLIYLFSDTLIKNFTLYIFQDIFIHCIFIIVYTIIIFLYIQSYHESVYLYTEYSSLHIFIDSFIANIHHLTAHIRYKHSRRYHFGLAINSFILRIVFSNHSWLSQSMGSCCNPHPHPHPTPAHTPPPPRPLHNHHHHYQFVSISHLSVLKTFRWLNAKET